MIKHTPTPWRISYDGGYFIEAVARDQIGRICTLQGERLAGQINAAHIVRCVNQHDELLAALKCAIAIFEQKCEQTEDMRPVYETLAKAEATEKADE